jgi:hypothetical protein
MVVTLEFDDVFVFRHFSVASQSGTVGVQRQDAPGRVKLAVVDSQVGHHRANPRADVALLVGVLFSPFAIVQDSGPRAESGKARNSCAARRARYRPRQKNDDPVSPISGVWRITCWEDSQPCARFTHLSG